jgi:cytochrome c oxidase assembly protein subunit 15
MHLNSVGLLWLRRYAVFVACCTFGLVIAGAMVVSNDAALSVPDWPLSWGHLMPTLEGGIRYEFAHRVAAMLVGLLTVGLAVWMQVRRRQAKACPTTAPAMVGHALACQSERSSDALPTKFAWAAVAVVLLQAALGGVAVRFVTPAWATIAHASLGQLFFAILVAICVALYAGSPRTWAAPASICAAGLFAQTILGAAVRYGAVAAVAHIVSAMLATMLVMWAALSILMRQMDNPKLRRAAMLLLSVAFSQVFLGIAAMMARVVYADASQPMPMMVLFTVAHVAVGSLALGAAVALAMLVRPGVYLPQGGQATA